MTLDLIYDGYEDHLYDKHIEVETDVADNITREFARYVFKFPNKYGVEVVKHKYSKGYTLDRWQLTPIKFDEAEDNFWYMDARDPLGFNRDQKLVELDLNRTRGSLTDEQVCKYLEQYKNL